MRHIVLLNVAGHGYTTYAGSPSEGFDEQPLGITTDVVSESALIASNELNEVVRQPSTRVSLTMRHDPEQRPVLAFGAFYPSAVDDKGREGLVLVHVIELEDTRALVPVVWGVVELLCPAGVAEFGDGVAAAAVREGEVGAFLRRYATRVEASLDRARLLAPVVERAGVDLARVEHDCAGAAPLAWLMAAHAMTGRPPGWSVFDRELPQGVETLARPEGTVHVKASELLYGVIQDHIATGRYLPAAQPQGDAASSTLVERSRMFTNEKTTVDRRLPEIPSAPEPAPEDPTRVMVAQPAAARVEPAPSRRGFSLAVGVGCVLVGMLLGFIPATLAHSKAPANDCADAAAQAPSTQRAAAPSTPPPTKAPAPTATRVPLAVVTVDAGGVDVRAPVPAAALAPVRSRPRDPPRSRSAQTSSEDGSLLPHGVQ